MLVSVVIPTANRCDLVMRTVGTVLQQDFPASDFEIIVAVDGVRDGTADALRTLGAKHQIRVLELERNQGPSAARNAGLRAAKGELVVFLDDDMNCTSELLRSHVAAHVKTAERREIAGLGAIYVAPEHRPCLAAELFLRGLGGVYLRHSEHPAEKWPENVWSFGNTSVGRAVLERVGGFDERFRKREDCELGIRLLEAGVRQEFVGDAVAYQWCEKSAEQLVRDAEIFAESDVMFLRIHPGWSPHEFLSRIREEKQWKRWARELLVRCPAIADLLLSPVCTMGQWRGMPGPLREVAVRALTLRCGLHWYHRLIEVSGRRPEDWIRGGSG
ncbi:glycosyltransferase family A protein [Telmatobacter sp. DSM 110680]|uniref:Glycosyltransferase family A protein n=1 Tax=Telmatobacter sp. DSM 110680 TaxID=3036704 RepID=A0AAU7DFX3_9BACT